MTAVLMIVIAIAVWLTVAPLLATLVAQAIRLREHRSVAGASDAPTPGAPTVG